MDTLRGNRTPGRLRARTAGLPVGADSGFDGAGYDDGSGYDGRGFDDERQPARQRTRSIPPAVAAFLSFLVPGLGQIALGSVRLGLLLAAPLIATVLVALFLFFADKRAFLGVIQPQVILGLVALDAFIGLVHLIAIGEAYRRARRRLARSAWTLRAGSRTFVSILLLLTLGIHGAIGAVGVQAYDTLNAVFTTPGSGYTIPGATFGPTGPGGSPVASAGGGPFAGPAWAADGRLNILLIGGDAGPGRWNLRTDTMIVMSADVATGKVALFGIPRNLYNAPLAPEDAKAFPGGIYPDLLNSLWVYADTHRNEFPGGDSAGFRAITGAVQQLVGVPLDGAVVVKLEGFTELVNALGGVWIDVASPIHDDRYPLEDGSGYIVLNIKAGCQHFNGHWALAYARSRHQTNDYNRMGRQQVVLEDLANQIDPLSLIPQVPHLLDIAGTNLKTSFSPADIPSLAQFASTIDKTHIKNVLFDPPTYPEFLTSKEIAKIQRIVRNVFNPPAPGASPSPFDSPVASPTLNAVASAKASAKAAANACPPG